VKGVLICVLASGLLIVIFALLIGAVVAGIINSSPKKEKSQKDNLTKSDIEVDEKIEEGWIFLLLILYKRQSIFHDRNFLCDSSKDFTPLFIRLILPHLF